jgi:uncharacterized protein YpmB
MAKKGRKDIIYIVIIIVLVLVIASMLLQNVITTGSQQQAIDKLKAVYELITESNVEVLNVEEVSGMFKVLLRTGGTTGDRIEEVYITKDGRLITDKIIVTEDYKTSLEDQKAFAECLKDKGFLVFGQSNEPNTIQQLQIIGSFSYKIYVDCVDANLQACQQIGIQEIPTIIYNRMNYTGVKTREWIETLTGCKY